MDKQIFGNTYQSSDGTYYNAPREPMGFVETAGATAAGYVAAQNVLAYQQRAAEQHAQWWGSLPPAYQDYLSDYRQRSQRRGLLLGLLSFALLFTGAATGATWLVAIGCTALLAVTPAYAIWRLTERRHLEQVATAKVQRANQAAEQYADDEEY